MEELDPAGSDRSQGYATERNQTQRKKRMHRRSLPGSQVMSLVTHHGFSTPKVVRAAHWPVHLGTPQEVWTRGKDTVACRGRLVARNLFLDRVRDLSKSEMV